MSQGTPEPLPSPSWVTFPNGSPPAISTDSISSESSPPSGSSTLNAQSSNRRPLTPRLSTSDLNYASLGHAGSTLSNSAANASPRPPLGRSVTSPHLLSPTLRKRLPPSTPRTPQREWSVFSQLMENEGQLMSSRAGSFKRSGRGHQGHGRSISGEVTPRESVVAEDSMENSYSSVDVQSPVAEEESFRNNFSYDYSSDFDSDSSHSSDSDSDSDATISPIPTPVRAGPQPPPPPTSQPPKWYSPKRLSNVPVLYRNIFKCALAYFIASLFTFSPYLSGFISDLVSRGKGGGRPLPSGHMVATVAVYFNPAKTMGGMVEADVFCMFGLFYAAAVCLSCMSVFWWLEGMPGYEWVGDIFAVVWVGLAMSLLAWLKVWMANPQFNTACSMMAIILFVVLIKEGGFHTLLSVSGIVLTGAVVSNIVCYLVWPASATENLQSNMVKTLDSFSTLLSMLTETFLLEPGAISNHRNSQGKIHRAVEAHQGSFTGLKKSLKEAKSEWLLWGRMRRPDWSTVASREARIRNSQQTDGYGAINHVGEDSMKGKGRRRAYEDAVDSLNRLGQHLNGLRSGTRLQYELTKAGIVETKAAAKGKGHPRKSNAYGDLSQSMHSHHSHYSTATTKTGLLVDVSIGEEDDEETAILKTAAAMFGDLVDDLGPPLKALTRKSKSKSQKPEFTIEEFTELIDGIQKALRRFESTSNHALLRLYRKSDLSEQLSEHLSGHRSDRGSAASVPNTSPPTPRTPATPGVSGTRRNRSGTVLSRMDNVNANTFLNGPNNEHVFLVYFFIFTLQEFAQELILLVDAMERIYAIERQSLTWSRWWAKLWAATKMKFVGMWSAFRAERYRKNGRRTGGLRRRLSKYVIPEKRGPRPVFPKVKPHAPDTIQTPSRKDLSFMGKTKQLIWSIGKRLTERDTKYAIKAGMATAMLAAPAFFDATRPFVLEFNVDWALISFFVVISPTIGATNFLGLHRVVGTLFGAAVAAGIYTLFPDNAPVLAIFGFFFSIPCFYYLVAFPQYASSARFVLLTYNLTCLYCYNKREKDLAVTIIAADRAIAVTAGVVWAAVVSRFWWPAEARRELSKALGEFCLNLGWLYTRLVTHNSFATEQNVEQDSGRSTPSDEDAPLISAQHLEQRLKLNNSIHEFMAMELHLQIKLIELQGLLGQAQHEPRLKGPFPVQLYRGVLTSLQTILDKLHSMRPGTASKVEFRSGRRRNALRQLIEATHSSNSQLKVYAAKSIPDFFQDFPDLEEDAINSVYDLCEDLVVQVRMEGYKTLAILSKLEKKWVKRNADVLVQLLQTDDPNEVNVVKRALVEHLHLDPRITLGVLCDQLIPPEGGIDPDDTTRLRKLVISFLTGEIKKGSLQRVISPDSEAESALVEGLIRSISKLDNDDILAVVNDIFLQLSSTSQPSAHATIFGQSVLERAKLAREMDLYASKDAATLDQTRPYLDLLSKIFIEKKLGAAEELLKFYNPLVGKPVLQKISPDDRILVIYYLTEAVAASPQNSTIVPNVLKVSQACFEFLAQSDLAQERPTKASIGLLQSSQQLLEGGWQMPPLVASAIQALGRSSNIIKSARSQEIQELIRVRTSKTQATNLRKRASSSPNISSSVNSLPPRPPSAVLPRRPSEITASVSLSGPSRDADIKPHLSVEDRPAKKPRKAGDPAVPSLLSRLSTGTPTTTRRQQPERGEDVEPPTGFSIKGAASRNPDNEGQTTLMTRLNGASSSTNEHEQVGRSRKRKKGSMQ
ncbi:hypothetical protein D9758_013030 [Tetrapyrgos nigripes]|uniref:Integral membrane bound transporter domain-containing protein n=1 Tax=Tetrapyrgos nigripes TaxID=182062 RepID=A0A8H5CAE7_9AGAR|nr:hypothetical protein D9758_013030 [Tetrapyrgos nigripes]